ncbi:hypothetical protein Mgra_00001440 [Meloidogyne graminicola]|uniref:Uncharacterized protein n=1 Tax=Meloidogyne graminicola TaxID=189291 RepID=A0A8T0A0Y5_9BILA|nr:hypothetical protein Mgra_00001440 [Meloidogyne graminicola]
MQMDEKPIVVDPQTQIDEHALRRAFMRWLLFISFKRAFVIFKEFTRQPTFLGFILLISLLSPSTFVFHLFFNKMGISLRYTLICSLCTPFILLIISFIIYLQFSESLRHFLFIRMLNFTFPENYFSIASSRSLDFASPLIVVHAIKSNDPMLRLYGLKQLQRTCTGTPMQRMPLYSLSQPGEHPRNWLALREVSIQLIQDVIYNLQQQTKFHCVGVGGRKAAIAEFIDKDGSFSTNSQIENVSPTIVLNELYEGRRSLFMPPALKPRSAEQFQAELQPRKVIRLPSLVEMLLLKASRLFFLLFHSPVLGVLDTLSVLLAIKVLSLTIIHSINEDRFGVVQKDLKLCISKLTRLSIAIDAYVHAKRLFTRLWELLKFSAFNLLTFCLNLMKIQGFSFYFIQSLLSAAPSNINQYNVHLLDVELAAALKDIRSVFSPDLNLHPTEAERLFLIKHMSLNIEKQRPFDFSRYPKRRIAIMFLYLGWDFEGLVRQENTLNTVEQILFNALIRTRLIESAESCDWTLAALTVRSTDVSGEGCFWPENTYDPDKCIKSLQELPYIKMLNGVLPKSIRIISFAPVDKGFRCSLRLC